MKKLSFSELAVLQTIVTEVRFNIVKSEFDSSILAYIDNGRITLSFNEDEYQALQTLYKKVFDLSY